MKNKARYAQWAKLGIASGGKPAVVMPKVTIKMLNLPGFRELEDKFILYSEGRGQFPLVLQEMAEALSLETFGIRISDTELPYPEDFDSWTWDSGKHFAFDEACERHDEQFETLSASDEEAVEILLRFGIDFRDELENPMKSISLFCLQAEAAAKGIKGKLPDLNAVSLKRWGDNVELEAKAYMQRKKR